MPTLKLVCYAPQSGRRHKPRSGGVFSLMLAAFNLFFLKIGGTPKGVPNRPIRAPEKMPEAAHAKPPTSPTPASWRADILGCGKRAGLHSRARGAWGACPGPGGGIVRKDAERAARNIKTAQGGTVRGIWHPGKPICGCRVPPRAAKRPEIISRGTYTVPKAA